MVSASAWVSRRRASAMSSGCGGELANASANTFTMSSSARVCSSPALGSCFSIGRMP